jgi:lipopolysaccharide/colanic/teichoic acid biosynthesis glycosyltransferase
MKRTLDIVLSACGILLLLPLLMVIALAILTFDGPPVLFRQERVGYKRKSFRIWKFRTMRRDAEKHGKLLTVGCDPRITRIGYWLRKSKLDELPQLFNVLLGQMSFVGPRPEVKQFVDLYSPEQSRVLELVPGITDAASICYRNESDLLAKASNPEQMYIDVLVPEKIRLNLAYAQRASVVSDLGILFQTLAAILRPK